MGPLSIPSIPSVVRACTEDTKLLLGGGTDLWLSSGAQPWLGVPAALSQVGRAAVQRWCGQMVSWQDVLLSCFFPTNCYLASASILKFLGKKHELPCPCACWLAGQEFCSTCCWQQQQREEKSTSMRDSGGSLPLLGQPQAASACWLP